MLTRNQKERLKNLHIQHPTTENHDLEADENNQGEPRKPTQNETMAITKDDMELLLKNMDNRKMNANITCCLG